MSFGLKSARHALSSLTALAGSSAALATILMGCSSLTKVITPHASQQREFVIERKWTRATPEHDYFGYHRMNRMSPIVLDKLVIQGNAIDGISAYDRSSGNERWRLAIKGGVEGGAQVVKENLYFGASDGNLYCVRVSDGTVQWSFPVKSETLAPPTVEDGVVYVENGSDVVYAVDATNGKQIWLYNRQTTGNFSIRATTRPVVTTDNVFVGFSDGYVVALKRRDGVLNWERKIGRAARFKDVDGTPVLDGGQMFVSSFDGTLYSLKPDTGEVNWSVDSGGYVPVTVGPDHFSDFLYYATADGKILVIEKHSGKIQQTFMVKKGIATQPVFFRGVMIYGESDGALIAADPNTGAPIGRFAPGFGLMAKPTIIESTGEAYFMSSGANLFALHLGYERFSDLLPWQNESVR